MADGKNANGNAAVPTVKSPVSLAHVVLRTNPANYNTMITFYTNFLGGTITFKNDTIAFLRYDEEHHRIAIIAVPGTAQKVRQSAGLEHVAFTFATLDDLVLAYTQRKAHDIHPTWCINHGPTTSMYYNDPDGNVLETQVDNFDTAEAANDFMASTYFAENPVGTEFDPEELIERLEAGESHCVIKKRTEIGPRQLPKAHFQ